MALDVIADSDDEGELGFTPPPWSPITDHGEAQSSDYFNHAPASASTDPGLFKSVLDEQRKAVRQQANVTVLGKYQETFLDPYDVPSSPVEILSGQKRRKTDCDTSDKRRKVNRSTKSHDEVDLVVVPSQLEHDRDYPTGATSSMLPPTLPFESRTTSVVAPQPLTNSEQLQHQSLHVGSSDLQSEDQGPSRPGCIIRSSGSATIINTPRDEEHSIQSTSVNSGASNNVWLKEEEPRESSPDHFVAPEPARQSARTTKKTKKKKQKEKDLVTQAKDRMPDELGAQYNPDSLIVAQPKDELLDELETSFRPDEMPAKDDYESDFTEKSVKAKKQRGRRKKSVMPEAAATTTTGLMTPQAANEESVPKPKKKRGRSRKADQHAVDPPQEPSTCVEANLEKDVQADCHGPEQAAAQYQKRTEDTAEAKISISLNDSEINAASTKKEDALPPADEVKDTSTTILKPVQNTGHKEAILAIKHAASVPGSASKPLYRVGLSKKSRIAPLLTIVRK